MKQRIAASLLLILFCWGCAAPKNTPVTWKQDEDEIIFYVYLSKEASAQLVEQMNDPVNFEQVSEFLVKNTDGRIPFTEGIMTAAAVVAHQTEVKAILEKNKSSEGNTIEIIGFKENPVKIVKGAFKELQTPKYLSDFDSREHPEIVQALHMMMDGNSFVLAVY
jgi:hypothetical protein